MGNPQSKCDAMLEALADNGLCELHSLTHNLHCTIFIKNA